MAVIVTRDQLAGIMGIFEFGGMVAWMRTTADPMGQKALPTLEMAALIDLSNVEVNQLKDYLVVQGAISADAASRVDAYVAAATPAAGEPTSPAVPGYAHRYRVPIPPGTSNAVDWVGGYVTADLITEEIGPDFLIIATNGDCTAPGAEVI